MNTADAVAAVRAVLGPEFLLPSWRAIRPVNAVPSWGCCYVACEAVQELSDERLTPCTVRVAGGVHWYLRAPDGWLVDPTWDQFATPPNYHLGRGRGFLTKGPSKRARKLLTKVRRAALAPHLDSIAKSLAPMIEAQMEFERKRSKYAQELMNRIFPQDPGAGSR